MSDLLSLAEWGVKRALEFGAGEAEVYVSISVRRNIRSEGVHLKASASNTAQVEVRAALGKRVSIATASSLDKEVLEDIVRKAVELASKAEEDPHWNGLPDPEPAMHSWVGFDEGVATAELSWLSELTRQLIDEAQVDPRIKVSGAGVGAGYGRTCIASSRNVTVEDRGTFFWAGLYLKAGEGAGGANIASRSFTVNLHPMVEKAVRQALDASRATKLGESFKAPVLFRAEPFAELLSALLVPAFNAMNVLEGFSPLANKLSQNVLGNVTILDDGTMPGGLSTSFFDGEGVPRRRSLLVENGVLKGYLHNTYTARRMGVHNTGNAVRARGTVGVGSSNLIVAGGSLSEKNLENGARIIIEGGLLSVHTVNPISGNFSVVASNPYIVKDGELVPIKPIAVSGNIYQLAYGIKLARRVKDTYTGIYTPDALIEGVTVSG